MPAVVISAETSEVGISGPLRSNMLCERRIIRCTPSPITGNVKEDPKIGIVMVLIFNMDISVIKCARTITQ